MPRWKENIQEHLKEFKSDVQSLDGDIIHSYSTGNIDRDLHNMLKDISGLLLRLAEAMYDNDKAEEIFELEIKTLQEKIVDLEKIAGLHSPL